MWTTLLLHSLAALVLIIAATQLVDWVFSGMKWSHKYYATHPEVWRPLKTETTAAAARAVWVSLGSSFVFALAYIIFYVVLQPGVIFGAGSGRAIAVALITWSAIPLPFVITQHVFIKYHWVSSAALAAAWFFKILIASFLIMYLI